MGVEEKDGRDSLRLDRRGESWGQKDGESYQHRSDLAIHGEVGISIGDGEQPMVV